MLVVATRCASSSRPYTAHCGLVLKPIQSEKACQLDCFARLGTALKRQAPQDGDNTEEHESERVGGDVFNDWNLKKLRLF